MFSLKTNITYRKAFRWKNRGRRGFTLIEMIVVVGIVLLLAIITATTINLTINGDKVRAGARQIQSYLAGARDRAIYAKAPRGVRFQLDSVTVNGLPSRIATSLAFIAPTDDWTQGNIWLEVPVGGGTHITIVRGLDNVAGAIPTQWVNLFNENLLRNGARILIPNDNTGTWYTVTTELLTTDPNYALVGPVLHLTTPYISPPSPTAVPGSSAFPTGSGPTTYRLQLAPSVLANQEPTLMPRGTVVDLDRCNKNPNSSPLASATSTLPQAWINTNIAASVQLPFIYTNQMDVMFSPRGTVIGPAASRGLIHFYIADQKDADNMLSPENAKGDKVIVSLFCRTGSVSVHPVDTADQTIIQGATVYDYFKFAETGQVAGK